MIVDSIRLYYAYSVHADYRIYFSMTEDYLGDSFYWGYYESK